MDFIDYRDKLLNLIDISYNLKSDDIKIMKKFFIKLAINGSIGWDKVHSKWVIGQFNSILDDDGDFTEYVAHTLSTTDQQNYVLKNHEEVIVCGNNRQYKSELEELNFYAEMLAETDTSIYYQLLNSRNIPMLQVMDDNVKLQIEDAFNKRKAGQPVIALTTLLSEIKTLDICDNSSIDKLSTLDVFHDELLKRWCNSHGIDVTTKEKKAQVNTMELEQFDDFDTLNFLEKYECLKEFIEEMEENNIHIELIRNPIYADEPSNEDIDNGTFEEKETEDETQNNEGIQDTISDNSDEEDKEKSDNEQ